jgi:hypothetical protein
MPSMKVKCPRCGKTWLAHSGMDAVDCNCHEYCEEGEKPGDCTLVAASAAPNDAWNGTYNWPQGMHLSGATGEDVTSRLKWCTTHSKWVTKVPILIPCDWDRWFSRRAKREFRWHKGVV